MSSDPTATEPSLSGIAAWAIDLMDTVGAPGAGLAIALENLFPPLPSEIILPLAGFSAGRGEIGLMSALVWTTLGSVVGALLWYVVGAAVGRDRARAVLLRLPLVKSADVDRTEAWFARHGVKTVFFGRMIPVFRSFISIPAGVERMPLAVFLLFTMCGSLVWNTVFVLAGHQLGQNWHVVEQYAGVFQKVVVIAVLVTVAGFVVLRLGSRGGRHRLRTRGSAAPPERGGYDRRRGSTPASRRSR